MVALFDTTPLVSITNDQLYECIGIESFLSRDVAARNVGAIRAHRDAIMTGQDHLTPEALSGTSMASSRWSRARAQSLAAMYLSD